MNYLQKELYDLVQSNPAIFDFLQTGSLDGIWYWDLENQEQEWISDRFWELLGYDPASMPHRADAWQEIIFQEDLDVATTNFVAHCADPNHPYDQIVRYRHKDGRTVTVRCRGIAIRDDNGTPIRLLGAHTDLTDLKRTEEALMNTNAELQAARDAAQAASDAKTAFLATMSHEIRNPLNGILGMSDVLSRADLDPDHMRMVHVIQKSGEHLLSLTNDMLDLSRIEAGVMDLEEVVFDAGAELDGVIRLSAPAAAKRGVDLTFVDTSETIQVRGSAKALRQVATNLVTNALKFTESGTIRLSLDVTDHPDSGDSMMTLVVADSGCGVPDDRKEAIFERFETMDSPKDFIAGIGLGLPIARRLCEMHGGQLIVADTPGGGATFEGSFRVGRVLNATASGATSAPMIDLSYLGRPLKLLVAEDNKMNRFVLSAMLDGADVDLTFALNGQEALKAACGGGFDGALFDIRMPEMNGDEALRALRTDEAGRGRPPLYVVALSANAMPDQLLGYLADGFDDTLAKPLSLETLGACITRLVSHVSETQRLIA